MNRAILASLVLVFLIAAIPSTLADLPDKFENLKVLPAEIGKRELVGAMQNFSAALGVKCTYCHLERTPGDHDSIDWATDELKAKKAARRMMEMVGTINGELLPGGGGESAPKVSCITCHRGVTEPTTLDHLVVKVVEDDGIDAAISKYRALREQHYGSGAYDFRAQSLASAAQSLAQKKDSDGAVKLLELNLEMNPKDADSYAMLGQIQAGAGDREAALTNLKKALELSPDHWRAKQMIERLGAAKTKKGE